MIKIDGGNNLPVRRIMPTGTGRVLLIFDSTNLKEMVDLLDGCTRIEAETLSGVDVYAAPEGETAKVVSMTRNLDANWMNIALEGLIYRKGAGA